MAIITVAQFGMLSPDRLDLWLVGGVLSMTPQSVVLYNPNNGWNSWAYTGIYSGSFATTISGDITGTVTAYSFHTPSQTLLTITGLSLEAAQVFTLVGNHDPAGLTALLFAGNDTFNGQAFLQAGYSHALIINGFAGNDVVYGSMAADMVMGDAGRDTLLGGMSQDSLQGGTGNDALYGESGDDAMSGDAGSDLLSGGWDSDTLVGGTGADQMYGGLGPDLFLWFSARDSGVTAAARDTVQDFSAADGDKLDLSMIDAKTGMPGDQAFVLVTAFDHHKGQLVCTATADGCLLSGDTNGDGLANFSIAFHGIASLTAADFVL